MIHSLASEPFILVALNIHTLQDKSDIDHHQRHTNLICKKLGICNTDAAALLETRNHGEGNIREAGSKYSILWKGKDHNEPRIRGV